ncbi:MAG: hypothetical protein K6F90_07795 [Lachnospiraceae bacterium]|nr:hypothetical protein [Lachnospiraceae bacterium]
MIIEKQNKKSKKIEYSIINSLFSLEELYEKYGEISYAYKSINDNKYYIFAISKEEPQYLKSQLLIDNQKDFIGVGTFIPIDYYGEVL